MPKFIRCSCENTKYRGYDQKNAPINIELVTQVEKFREKFYPDTLGTPAIKFKGIDKQWTYAKDEGKKRDKDYDRIISNDFSEPEITNYLCKCNRNYNYEEIEENRCRSCFKHIKIIE